MLLRLIVAILLGGLILVVGLRVLRALTTGPARTGVEEPEEVGDLEVYFVCRECGTELRVTRLGEAQVPRHCGEVMDVVRRPWDGSRSSA